MIFFLIWMFSSWIQGHLATFPFQVSSQSCFAIHGSPFSASCWAIQPSTEGARTRPGRFVTGSCRKSSSLRMSPAFEDLKAGRFLSWDAFLDIQPSIHVGIMGSCGIIRDIGVYNQLDMMFGFVGKWCIYLMLMEKVMTIRGGLWGSWTWWCDQNSAGPLWFRFLTNPVTVVTKLDAGMFSLIQFPIRSSCLFNPLFNPLWNIFLATVSPATR